MAVTEYSKFRSDTELRELYRQREKSRHDILSYTKTMVGKAREEGVAEGFEKRFHERFPKGFREWFAEEHEKRIAKVLAEARAKRFAEEYKKRLAEGEEKERTNLLLQAVESRFGKTKASFQKKIRAITDQQVVLKLLTVTIPAAQTIEDVEKAIPR